MRAGAQLISRVDFAGARQLINSQGRAQRSASGHFVAMAAVDRLLVYDLETLLAGDARPAVEFPVPEAAFPYSGTVTHDLATAVFSIASGKTAVQAIDPSGVVRWEWRYEHSEGSSLVTADGRHVWAVVAAWDKQSRDWTPEWVVLDAKNGRLLDRAPLPWRADEYELVAHPDNRHVSLCCVRQDGGAVFSGRFDDDGLRLWALSCDDELVTGFDPTGRLMAMTGADGRFIRLREFPHGAVVSSVYNTEISDPVHTEDVGSDGECGLHRWHQYAGFLDPTMLIASSGATEETTGAAPRHWLIAAPVEETGEFAHDVTSDTLRGMINYPSPADDHAMAHLWALGDGTWLTADKNTLYRWALA